MKILEKKYLAGTWGLRRISDYIYPFVDPVNDKYGMNKHYEDIDIIFALADSEGRELDREDEMVALAAIRAADKIIDRLSMTETGTID